jgi:hypothetical protein
VAEVAYLQRCQIKTMFAELDSTALEITGGIQDIRTAMEAVVGNATQSGQLGLGSDVVEMSVAAIRGALDICHTTIAKTDQVFACTSPLRDSFSVYTSRIAELAYGVRLSALNAQIYASNLDGGEALSVLSEQARQVSDRSMEEANLLSKRLGDIGASIEHSHQELETFQTLARAEQSAIQSETVLCEAKLHSLQEDMPRRLAEMQPNLAKLDGVAKRRANQLNFPLVVAEARSKALDLGVRQKTEIWG